MQILFYYYFPPLSLAKHSNVGIFFLLSVFYRDLSKNHISSLDTSLLDRLVGLRELWVETTQLHNNKNQHNKKNPKWLLSLRCQWWMKLWLNIEFLLKTRWACLGLSRVGGGAQWKIDVILYLSSLSSRHLQGNRIKVLPRGVFCCGPLSVMWVIDVTTLD